MNDKELYGLILSNINIFKEELLKRGNRKRFSLRKYIDNALSQGNFLYKNGVKCIWERFSNGKLLENNYFAFKITDGKLAKRLLELNVPIFQIQDNYYANCYYCDVSYLQTIIDNCFSEIIQIDILENYPIEKLLRHHYGTMVTLVKMRDCNSYFVLRKNEWREGIKDMNSYPINRDNILKNNKFAFCTHNSFIIDELLDLNIPVFQLNFDNQYCYYCDIFYLEFILEKYSSDIFDVTTLGHLIPIKLFRYYIKTIECHIRLIKAGAVYSSHFIKDTFSPFDNAHGTIEKYGIFAYEGVYKSIIWDFDSVDKFKDKLWWKYLIEYSNLKWNENDIVKYFTYIPFNKTGNSYEEKLDENFTISDFSNIGLLSNRFIEQNYRNINIDKFLETAFFKWNGDDLLKFYILITSIDLKYFSHSYMKSSETETTGKHISPYFFRNITENKKFDWNPELLKSTFEIKGNFDDFLSMNEKRRHCLCPVFKETFIHYPELKNKLDVDLFMCQLLEGEKRPYESYSMFFSTDNILQNSKEWNDILIDKIISTRKFGDSWLYGYQAKTMWNLFAENKFVILTYDICCLLKDMNIIIGGEYEKDSTYQDYPDFGFITKEINALDFFSLHPILPEDMEKILKDNELMSKLLSKNNESLINYILDRFFRDYSLEQFFEALELLGIHLDLD